uniref:Uncharacterized protein n=1 Tax=viral metagenome TaxID=1070528 RepID=A0A6M3JPP1_9ZZZZ
MINDFKINICNGCDFRKIEEEESTNEFHKKVGMLIYILKCTNIKSPLYGKNITDSHGCVLSTILSPEVILLDGRQIKDVYTKGI